MRQSRQHGEICTSAGGEAAEFAPSGHRTANGCWRRGSLCSTVGPAARLEQPGRLPTLAFGRLLLRERRQFRRAAGAASLALALSRRRGRFGLGGPVLLAEHRQLAAAMATAVSLALRLDGVERAAVADLAQLLGLQRLELAQRAKLPHTHSVGGARLSAGALSKRRDVLWVGVGAGGVAAEHTSASRRGSISLQATRIAACGAAEPHGRTRAPCAWLTSSQSSARTVPPAPSPPSMRQHGSFAATKGTRRSQRVCTARVPSEPVSTLTMGWANGPADRSSAFSFEPSKPMYMQGSPHAKACVLSPPIGVQCGVSLLRLDELLTLATLPGGSDACRESFERGTGTLNL